MVEQIWISPIVEQILNVTEDGAAYHGYWAKDIFQLNANFGTADDLKNLSDELHARGMVSLLLGSRRSSFDEVVIVSNSRV